MGGQRVQIEWRLRKVMASRNVWNATELRELLVQRAGFELSLQSVDVLMKKPPVQVKVATMQALRDSLGLSVLFRWRSGFSARTLRLPWARLECS